MKTSAISNSHHFQRVLLPEGWADQARLLIDDRGVIGRIETGVAPETADLRHTLGLPGLVNLHSHAFQRAMAGLAEKGGPAGDDFWGWRQVMYRFLQSLVPDDVEAIAGQLYLEMLKAGYTEVAEFHYLHHQPDGRPHDDPGEMSFRIAAAARRAGIGLTHLPVFYAHGGFGGQAPGEGQRRFINDVDRFLGLYEGVRAAHGGDPLIRIGWAAHSLRAVDADALLALCSAGPDGPIHIHIAEQVKEVDDCLAWSGTRPVRWLYDHAPVDGRWCLVHATHLDESEIRLIADSGAVAGLCPTTEANLGDGLFPLRAFAEAGGVFGIGSDSHVSLSVAEELRLLEYGARLHGRARNLFNDGPGDSTGGWLFRHALAGGARAVGLPAERAGLAVGNRADFLVLDETHPSLVGRREDQILDSLVFVNAGNPIRHVFVAGRPVITDGHHAEEAAIATEYGRRVNRLVREL